MFLKQGEVVFTEEPAADAEGTTQWRFTLKQLSMLDDGRYLWARDQVERWVENTTGQKREQYLTVKPVEAISAEERRAFDLFLAGLCWAHIYAALKELAQRPVSLELEPLGEWVTVERPAEWENPEVFLGSVDPDLVGALERKALDLNPTFNILRRDDDGAKKKYGVRLSSGPKVL